MCKKLILAFLMIFTVAMTGCGTKETLDLVSYDKLNPNDDVKLTYVDLNYGENKIDCLFENNSSNTYHFGFDFSIERKQGDKWYRLNTDQNFIALSGEIEANSTHIFYFDLDTQMYELSEGDYRMVKTLSYNDEDNNNVFENYSFEFTIREKNKAPIL